MAKTYRAVTFFPNDQSGPELDMELNSIAAEGFRVVASSATDHIVVVILESES